MNIHGIALSPIHTADADATKLSSFVASAVCTGWAKKSKPT